MIIKITGINDSKLGTFDAKEIVGDRIDGEGEWRKKCFANNAELMDQLSEFGIGEVVNVRCVKGKGTNQYGKPNYNIAGFEEASDELIATVMGNPTQSGSGVSGSQTSAKPSTYTGRSGEAWDRSAAIYLAADLMKYNHALNTKNADKRVKTDDLLALAAILNAYIHDGDDGTDPLDPPEIS
jgi:hypothetical protein